MKWISSLLLLPLAAFALPVQKGQTFKVQIPGEYIVTGETVTGETVTGETGKSLLNVKRQLGKNLYLVKASEKSLAAQTGHPNYAYYGNHMENVPNDDLYADQFHHQMIFTNQAWNTTTGSKEIVVAVTDNEFEMDHDDLKGQWWVNQNEIPGNGIDDDNNGYVDDVNGWDFMGQDNDMNDDTGTHGTHVAGIIAAKANNKIGVAGIAPNVKVMPLRWYGSERRWSSAIVAETYHYAVDNGANIITTSYNIDGLADDEAYRDAVRYASANNVLIFNSAGNGSKKNPNRQKVEEIALVCSVKSKDAKKADKKSSFSNYGTGIDVCAPGDPILSTVRGRYLGESRYGELRGTSMAAPAAAAVAALIWSHNPNFSAEEVKQRLFESSDNIDKKNFWHKGLLGAGRINAFKALE
ncbi:MAG: S8 family serine peptidase [Bacteriovoracaceae bacterium]